MGTYFTKGATKNDVIAEILGDLKAEPYHPFKSSWDYETQRPIPGPPQLDETKTCQRLKHSVVGNNLWILFATTDQGKREVTVLLYRLESARGDWGYKPMDESMGPYEYDVPFTWLDELTAAPNHYAEGWRQKVRAAYGRYPKPTHGNQPMLAPKGWDVV